MGKMSKYDEFIQPFLDGELSREELDWFSKELESNAVLAEDIRLYREVDNAIREQDVMELRDQLDVIHNSIGDSSVTPARKSQYRRVLSYGAIASLTILLSLGVLLKVQHNKLTGDQIGSKFFQVDDITLYPTISTRSAESDELLQEANQALNEGNYYVAIDRYTDLINQDSEDMGSVYARGVAEYEIESYIASEKDFKTVINDNDNAYTERAEYCLGYCYLQTGQNMLAREQFKKIARSSSFYSKDARKVMRKIKVK